MGGDLDGFLKSASASSLESISKKVSALKQARLILSQAGLDSFELKKAQARLMEKLARLEAKKPINVVKVVKAKKPIKAKKAKKVKTKKPVLKRKSVRKTYIASKEGKKFHMPNCPFAQNIKPKTRVKFKTKTRPLNLGYKPCSCVK